MNINEFFNAVYDSNLFKTQYHNKYGKVISGSFYNYKKHILYYNIKLCNYYIYYGINILLPDVYIAYDKFYINIENKYMYQYYDFYKTYKYNTIYYNTNKNLKKFNFKLIPYDYIDDYDCIILSDIMAYTFIDILEDIEMVKNNLINKLKKLKGE